MSRIDRPRLAALAAALLWGLAFLGRCPADEIGLGRRAAQYGRFAEAEAIFLKVGRETSGKTLNTARMARLNLALLYKSFNRLADAKRICRDEITAGGMRKTAAENAEALAPFRIALAGVFIFEGDLNGANQQIGIAKECFTSDQIYMTQQGREVLHLNALIEFLHYKKTPAGRLAAEDLAGHAEKCWQDLLYAQQLRKDLPGEARTELYLSQLCFLRWQRGAIRDAAAEIEKYRTAYTLLQKDVIEHKRKADEYQQKLEDYRAKIAGNNPSLLAELKTLRAERNTERDDLVTRSNDLRRQRAVVISRYDAAWSDMLPGGPQASAADSTGEAKGGPGEQIPQDVRDARARVAHAAALLEESPIYPTLQYAALCHRAAVLRAAARWDRHPSLNDEIERCLTTAVKLLEIPRLSFSESEVDRAEFLFQYTQAFDQLIEWYRQHDETKKALIYAEMCRSRSLLDWIGANGGDDQQMAMERTQKEAEKIDRLTRQAESPVPGANAERNKMLAEIETARLEYVDKRQRELNRTAAGRAGFGKILTREDASEIIQDRIDRRDLVLYYHAGASNTYLFVLGLDSQPKLYRLGYNAAGVDRASAWVAQENVPAVKIDTWVKDYLKVFAHRGEFPKSRPARELSDHADLLLPQDLRQELRAAIKERPRPLIISADGALEQLPFEALWVKDKDREPSFLVDYLFSDGDHASRQPSLPQGIAYTPSLTILRFQEESESRPFQPSLVTAARSDFAAENLEDLRLANGESKAVCAAFAFLPADSRKQLLDKEATKRELLHEIKKLQPACVHLATHCENASFASKLLLYPGSDAGPHDDGGLTTGEISSGFPLDSCRLAVLSACRTNVGSKIEGEMSMSIARAFLAAHAHRVVASQWPVDDAAACQFATDLLNRVAHDWQNGIPCDYAAAMIAARRNVRSDFGDDPFYWAPFILIGPPRDGTK